MTKRAFKKFKRNERDFYETPVEALRPLYDNLRIPHGGLSFCDPCAGFMAIHRGLRTLSGGRVNCTYACDINPDTPKVVETKDALEFERETLVEHGCKVIITNPPWTREILHPLIEHLSDLADTWLLFDSDWAHTKQSVPYLPRLRRIVSVGRVKWVADSPSVGFDNCCWYQFGKPMRGNVIEFVGRSV